MKRSFRVGTVLTGAAACTAAFTPVVAAAAPAVAARVPGPAITEVDCPQNQGNYAHYVHLYWAAYAKHGPTCIGGKGTHAVDHSFVGFCPGNNTGWITYLTPDGTKIKYDYSGADAIEQFSHGSAFYVLSVHISHWSSSSYCAY